MLLDYLVESGTVETCVARCIGYRRLHTAAHHDTLELGDTAISALGFPYSHFLQVVLSRSCKSNQEGKYKSQSMLHIVIRLLFYFFAFTTVISPSLLKKTASENSFSLL